MIHRVQLSWVNRSMQSYLSAGITTKGKAMPIFPWIGPAYVGCRGTDCSMRDAPESWNGFPGCDEPTATGWQLCPALRFGQLMNMLPNSTSGGLEWSDKWQQPFFSVPPGVYPSQLTNANGSSATIWIDNGTSMAPKCVS
jgi:hypothetical protein